MSIGNIFIYRQQGIRSEWEILLVLEELRRDALE